jgi:hypothetical protein
MKNICIAFFLVVTAALADDQRQLGFRPYAVDFSVPLNRVIAITRDPHRLVILDPVANTFTSIALALPPLSVSVSPDGNFAAVGEEGEVTYINLATATIVRRIPFVANLDSLVLGNGWVYSRHFGSMQATTGTIVPNQPAQNLLGARPNLDPASKNLYSDGSNVSFARGDVFFDIAAGPIGTQRTRERDLGFPLIRPTFSADGLHLFTSNGSVGYRTDLNEPEFLHQLRLDDTTTDPIVIRAVSPIRVAVSRETKDNELFLYDGVYLDPAGHLVIPDFAVNANKYRAHGKWGFFDSTGAKLYVISQADATSGLSDDFGLYTIAFDAPAPCTATFATGSAASGFYGSTITVGIDAAQNCFYQATTQASWIRLGAGAYGSGDGTLTVAIRPNRTASPRTGTISLGAQQFTITQPARGSSEVPALLPSKVAAADYSTALDALIVAVSDPPELLVQTSTEDVFIPLNKRPLSVSVSPDGQTTVVGHPGWATVVNLANRTVTKNFPVLGELDNVTVAGNGFVYGSTTTKGLAAIHLASGQEPHPRQLSFFYQLPSKPALHPSGAKLYWNRLPYSIPADGIPVYVSPGTTGGCGNLIVTDDGTHVVDACAKVAASSFIPAQDLLLQGALDIPSIIPNFAQQIVAGITDIGARRALAVITSRLGRVPAATYGDEMQLFNDTTFGLSGKQTLPMFNVGGTQYQGIGRKIFFAPRTGQAPDRIVVLLQADPAAGIISNYGTVTFEPNGSPNCVSLPTSSATLGAASIDSTFLVSTAYGCLWDAVSTVNWISVTSAGLASGNATVSYSVLANATGAARTGTITVADKIFTVSQAAGSGTITLSPTSQMVPATGGSAVITVTSTSPSFAWTASSNAPWITVSNGATGTGSGSVRLTVAANNLILAPRSGTVTIAGFTATIMQPATMGMRYVPIPVCRLVDTRNPAGPLGGPFLTAGATRSFPLLQGACGIPSNATAYSLNVTAVPKGPLGYITVWPSGDAQPATSTLNSVDGRVKANAALVRAGSSGGAVSVFATDPTDVILDITGYFVQPQGNALSFYPLTPCRLFDTRVSGGPLPAGGYRILNPNYPCGVPDLTTAISLNATVVPTQGPFGYLTLYSNGSNGTPRPIASTLNAVTGAVTANAALVYAYGVPRISIFASDPGNVIFDVNGYFAEPGGAGVALQFYPITPCRVSDTRNAAGPLGGPVLAAGETRTLPVQQSACGIPPEAQAYVLNATVVPSEPFGYLTLWPAGGAQPTVSTLNAVDGVVTSNMAIVPAGTNGAIQFFGSNTANVIFDISGYFAP